MSSIIAAAAIRGAHNIVSQADDKYQAALNKWGPTKEIGFPNTAYFLPVIFATLGIKIETMGDVPPVLKLARAKLPPLMKDTDPVESLAPVLEAGLATLWAEEIIEAVRYLETPDFYTCQEDPLGNNFWLGAADDVILRKRGVEFVDGTAPGFAAILGSAPTKEIAAEMALELQKKNLYVFMAANHNGTSFSEQLRQAGVQVGWPTRLVPFGPDISAAIFALGFATRAALSFGGIEPGDFRKVLI